MEGTYRMMQVKRVLPKVIQYRPTGETTEKMGRIMLDQELPNPRKMTYLMQDDIY